MHLQHDVDYQKRSTSDDSTLSFTEHLASRLGISPSEAERLLGEWVMNYQPLSRPRDPAMPCVTTAVSNGTAVPDRVQHAA
jgi:hypothetical protein